MPHPTTLSAKLRFGLLPLALLVGLNGCKFIVEDDDPSTAKSDLYLDSYQQPCTTTTNINQLCWRQRKDQQSNWILRYEAIQNFTYKWGHSYKLLISGDPSGVIGSNAQLVAIQEDQEDKIGREYQFNNITLVKDSFSTRNNNYYFYNQQMTCKYQKDCDNLVSQSNSGNNGIVNLKFSYTGNAQTPIELIWWN